MDTKPNPLIQKVLTDAQDTRKLIEEIKKELADPQLIEKQITNTKEQPK